MMNDFSSRHASSTPELTEEISFAGLMRGEIKEDQQLFYMLAAASFVEITSDLYSGNLIALFHNDGEITSWLSHDWEPDELLHGACLQNYVQTVWPDFDWHAGYRGFWADYSRCCAIDRLAESPAQELVARCVVETGTASFYRALSEMTTEPVLKDLTARICADEIRHYKNFHRFFLRYRRQEQTSRFAILRSLWRRTKEIKVEDSFIAFKHVFLAANPGRDFQTSDYDDFRAGVRKLARRHFPYDMAVRMILKPLELSPAVARAAIPAIVSMARVLLLR